MSPASKNQHTENKDDNQRCLHCGQEKIPSELHSRLVRDGISTEQLSLPFIYRKKQLCSSCFEWQRKKDKLDKVLAIIGIIIVITLMVAGFFPLIF